MKPHKRYLYKQFVKVEPRDPKKVYVDIKHVEIIAGLLIVAIVLSAILSIVAYVK